MDALTRRGVGNAVVLRTRGFVTTPTFSLEHAMRTVIGAVTLLVFVALAWSTAEGSQPTSPSVERMILEVELKVELESYSKILSLLNDALIEQELAVLEDEPNDAVRQKNMRDRRDRIEVLQKIAHEFRTRLIERHMHIPRESNVNRIGRGRPVLQPAEPTDEREPE
jgi:hypothetical protein